MKDDRYRSIIKLPQPSLSHVLKADILGFPRMIRKTSSCTSSGPHRRLCQEASCQQQHADNCRMKTPRLPSPHRAITSPRQLRRIHSPAPTCTIRHSHIHRSRTHARPAKSKSNRGAASGASIQPLSSVCEVSEEAATAPTTVACMCT